MAAPAHKDTKQVVQDALKQISELKTSLREESSRKVIDKLDKIAAGLVQVQL
jgi:hypothetical protein